ncbi:MAG TPA: condensation domain-containing protein [Pedobacter sp.]|nr:condensation domain-containing protein [Pedobacter sp.]
MRRRLILGERIMYVDAATAVNCVFTTKIKGSFTLERLRLALHKIQQKHPLLRASIREDAMGVPHFISSNGVDSIPIRIAERRSADDWKLESEKEWHKLFDGKNKPMARVVWLKDTAVSELLLVCPHCICDGTTLVTLMSELLMLIDKPEKEIGSYLPFISIEGLLLKSYSGRFGKLLKAEIFSVFARLFFLMKSRRRNLAQGKDYMVHRRVSVENTAALAAACKAEGVTIHAALCIAFLEAFKNSFAGKAKGKLICPVDIRRFVPEIKPDHMFAFAPIVELSAEPVGGFWNKARKIKEDLKAKIVAMDVHDLLLMSEYFHSSARRMVSYLKSAPGSHDITLSNMGRLTVPENFDTFEVEAIYSPTVAFPWKNPNTVTIGTYKGEMDFCLSSNEGFLAPEKASDILDQVLGLLIQGHKSAYV